MYRNTPPKTQTPAQSNKSSNDARITVTPPDKQDTFDLVLSRLQEVLRDATDRGAQQLKLDRTFVDAIIKAMSSRKEDFSELKGSLDGIKVRSHMSFMPNSRNSDAIRAEDQQTVHGRLDGRANRIRPRTETATRT